MATRPRPRFSVAMLAEEHDTEVLGPSIQSVRTLADEILVLYAGSADVELETLAGLGVTVRRAPWEKNRAALCNRLLREAAGQWILWLEPGEQLTRESVEALASHLEQCNEPVSAGRLWIEIPPGGPGQPAQQAARVRLIPNRADLAFEGRVRQSVLPSIRAAGLPIAAVPARIVRHPREHDRAWRAARAERDIELAMLEQGPNDCLPVRALLAMGDAARDLEDWPLARQAYSEAVRTAPGASTEQLQAYYGLLDTFAGDSGEADEQLAVALEALEAFPLDTQLLLAMGGYLQARDRLDLASRCFEVAVRFGQVDLETWHPCDLAQTAVMCLGASWQLQGRTEEAITALSQALGTHPEWMRVRRALLELLVRQGRLVEALRVAERLSVPLRQREPFRNAIRGACRAARQQWAEALEFLEAAWQAGCGDPICLRALVQARFATGRTEGLQTLLAQWEAADPESAEVRAYCQALLASTDSGLTFPDAPAAVSQMWVRIDSAGPSGPAAAHIPLVTQTVCCSPPYSGTVAECLAAAGPRPWPGQTNSTASAAG